MKMLDVYAHHGVLCSCKEEQNQNQSVCRKINGTGDHHVKEKKLDARRQTSHVFSHLQDSGFL
jgi:hypothetical protein